MALIWPKDGPSNQGRHHLKNSKGDSEGDVDKIFDLILYDFKEFGFFAKKVGGMHPPYPPPCDIHGTRDKGFHQIEGTCRSILSHQN